MSNNEKNQSNQQQTAQHKPQSPPEPDFNATPLKTVRLLDHEIPKPGSGSKQLNG